MEDFSQTVDRPSVSVENGGMSRRSGKLASPERDQSRATRRSKLFFGKFYAQITPSNLLNILMYFDFKIDQPFPNYQAQKVKFPNFT